MNLTLPNLHRQHLLEHNVLDLMGLFNELFMDRFRTILVRGEHEPLYLPAEGSQTHHQLIFANGYFASALHEISHWCIAGPKRRKQVDFGYWYQPDGRTPAQQEAFESAEVKPQALEWLFSVAAGHRFRFSADNLNGGTEASARFKQAVWHQVQSYLSKGLPGRADQICQALCKRYGRPYPLVPELFPRPEDDSEHFPGIHPH